MAETRMYEWEGSFTDDKCELLDSDKGTWLGFVEPYSGDTWQAVYGDKQIGIQPDKARAQSVLIAHHERKQALEE